MAAGLMTSMFSRNREFNQGLALFNRGRFFECHEVWEISWRSAHGSERALLQGLIQAAVALLHLERGNRRGANLVYAKARARLDALPADFVGLALEEFRVALAAHFTERNGIPSSPRLHFRKEAADY